MPRLARFAIFLACSLSALAVPRSAPWAAALEAGGSARIVSVTDGDTLTLDDGTVVRLVGIQAPKLPLGRPGFEAWPLADEARAALEELGLGRRVTMYYGGRRSDRYGRSLAHLYRDDGLWLQGEMLALGLARVYSFSDNRASVPEMLAREAAARAAGLGIWRNPFYGVRRAHRSRRRIQDAAHLISRLSGRQVEHDRQISGEALAVFLGVALLQLPH